MIFVDSSVWIAALRDGESREARRLNSLLDEDQAAIPILVFLEVIAGASRSQEERLRAGLEAVPLYYPTPETWRLAESWITAARESGERFGIADLVIGAIAAEHGAPLWSLDVDFRRMARLKLLSLFDPAA